MIKTILIISTIINILFITRFVISLYYVPTPTDWDVINQKAAIKFYYHAYHENIPPDFINATRMNNFILWLDKECTLDLTSLPPKYMFWCQQLKNHSK